MVTILAKEYVQAELYVLQNHLRVYLKVEVQPAWILVSDSW